MTTHAVVELLSAPPYSPCRVAFLGTEDEATTFAADANAEYRGEDLIRQTDAPDDYWLVVPYEPVDEPELVDTAGALAVLGVSSRSTLERLIREKGVTVYRSALTPTVRRFDANQLRALRGWNPENT
jgi:hypothetical protein